MGSNAFILNFAQLGRADVAIVGGKNASLGEMVRGLEGQGVRVPRGFATTARAYWRFLDSNNLSETVRLLIGEFNAGKRGLAEIGADIRQAFLCGEWPMDVAAAITSGYADLCQSAGRAGLDVAVRSSATAEDLPEASFAGQHESYLNIRGAAAVLDACRRCFASLFTDRAISYRKAKGFDHLRIALSIGVQQMVRSDLAGAGVMFTLDTETGFDKVVLLNASWGLGESVVKGAVDADEYQVFKPLLANSALKPIIEKKRGSKASKLIYATDDQPTRQIATSIDEQQSFVLSDDEILSLARWACIIEKHYNCPMDIEWAKDGVTKQLFIVQARPETVQARKAVNVFRSYEIKKKGRRLAQGLSVGDAIVAGRVCIVRNPTDIGQFVDGAILVAETTDPDWVPIMKRAAAVVTDHGARTSHAAIVSRELGLPAVVGTGNATKVLRDGREITVSCAEGDEGFVYEGTAEFAAHSLGVDEIPATHTQVMLNLANPAAALRWWHIPADGVGLARMESVVSYHIKVHPMALVRFDILKDTEAKQKIVELTHGYESKTEFFVDRLARGLARIAALFYPKPVIIRMSDFKTNEYANLIGGREFEPKEENPMLGFRGASRYYSPRYREGFDLECLAIRRLRNEMGLKNVVVMIPFCRSPQEADLVLRAMAENGLKRGTDGLQVYVMCEIPSNVILAKEFAARFDGFSIGSNDLTQLTLGVDRDSADLAMLFNEQDAAVEWMIERVISEAHKVGAKVGLCGQAPSDHPEFAEFLVACGIDSISVSPDSFIAVKERVAAAEAKRKSLTIERGAIGAAQSIGRN
jgi:pyruvate,water dikinase